MLAPIAAALLPSAPQLRLETIDLAPPTITLQLSSIQVTPPCPDCGQAAQRRHSAYVRTLADLPWANLAARLQLRVRRFFCDHVACARTTFTERLPALVAPHARRTVRLAHAQADIGVALGGAAGARLAAKQHMPASRNTVLRLIRQLPVPPTGAPRIIGVDDWAKRKGHTYGTIVLDLETHRPLDLLDDRLAETVESWLRAHPTVEVISRDRAEADATGATAGAPNAVQVADRFHILKNLCAAIEEELRQHGVRITRTLAADTTATAGHPAVLEAASGAAPPHARGATDRGSGGDAPDPRSPPRLPDLPAIDSVTPGGRRAEAARRARRNERVAQYTQVLALRADGLDQATIARRLGLSRRTVSRWVAAPGFPERKRRSDATSSLDPYTPYLLERWQAGCHNGTHLWRLIQGQGFAGAYALVAAYLAPLRRGAAMPDPRGPRRAADAAVPEAYYTAQQAAFLLLRRPTELTEPERQDLTRVQDARIVELYQLTQAFAVMVRERRATGFDAWLDGAASSAFPALRRFANGIRQDYNAVRAGLTLPYSQGAVEGHITRLKLVKRQMFGRAKLDLLRQRVLHAA